MKDFLNRVTVALPGSYTYKSECAIHRLDTLEYHPI